MSIRAPASRKACACRRLHLDNGDALCAAAVAGHGIAALPAFMIHKAVVAGELVPLLLPYEKVAAPVQVVYPSRKLVPAKVRAFVDHLVLHCVPDVHWDRDVFGPSAAPAPDFSPQALMVGAERL